MRFRKASPDEAESLTHLVMKAKAHWVTPSQSEGFAEIVEIA